MTAPDSPRLLVMAGSSRQASLNEHLAALAGQLAQSAGAAVQRLDLRALALPVYDGDLEAATGVPDSVIALLEAIHTADAVLLVTPEYNGFPPPLVLNAFDWLSRVPAQGDRPAGLKATANKPVGLLSASPGPLGGLRAMNYLRQYLQMAFGMLVVPQQFALGRAGDAFDAQGALKDPAATRTVEGVMQALLRLAVALRTRIQATGSGGSHLSRDT